MKTTICLILLALLAACGGGDEPTPDNVCLVDGKPAPVGACR